MGFDESPIFDSHAEQGVLGCMLTEDEWISKAAEDILPDYFYEPLHREVFKALVSNNSSDKVRLFDALKKELRESYDGDNIALLIQDCNELIPSASNLPSYVEIMRESWLKRSLGEALIKAQTMLGQGEPYEEIASVVDNHLTEQGEGDQEEKGHTEQLQDLISHLDKCQSGEKSPMGVSTGLPDLDYLSRGVEVGDMFVVAARPGVGKTTLGLNIATHAAVNDGKGVLFFSLEMDATKLWQRALASITEVDMYRMDKKQGLTSDDFKSVTRKITYLKKSGLRIIDKPAQTLYQIRATARSYCKNNDIKLIVVDYLQLIRVPGFKANDRQREVAEISLSLKALARELGVGFLVLAQINRENQRMGRRPQMSDLRESGAIECDADKIALLHQPNPEEDQVDLILDKNRNGNTGMVKLAFHKQINKFTEAETFDG
jgi:replicative DNA helicase